MTCLWILKYAICCLNAENAPTCGNNNKNTNKNKKQQETPFRLSIWWSCPSCNHSWIYSGGIGVSIYGMPWGSCKYPKGFGNYPLVQIPPNWESQNILFQTFVVNDYISSQEGVTLAHNPIFWRYCLVWCHRIHHVMSTNRNLCQQKTA